MKKLLLVIVALFSILSMQAQTIDELKAKAEQGLAEAQNKLGDCYRLGDGVTKDYIECAAIAIGFDIAGFGFTSACKTWSKVAIKRAFIAIAAKAIGPVGAVLTVGSFVGCL